MTGLRGWLRDYVLNFLRDPERKNSTEKRQSFRKSVFISTPMPLGSLAIDIDNPPPNYAAASRSVQDVTDPYPVPILRRSRYVSADQLVPKPIDMIVEDEEPSSDDEASRAYTPPPTVIPLSSPGVLPEPTDAIPTRRPAATKNFSRRFSRRFSTMSANSTHSYNSMDSKRNSRASTLSRQESRDEWVEKRSSSRFSQRLSNAFEHTKNYTPMNIY